MTDVDAWFVAGLVVFAAFGGWLFGHWDGELARYGRRVSAARSAAQPDDPEPE